MNYVTNQIFSDNRINIMADRLFYYLSEQFTWDNVKFKTILTGHCSAILQEMLSETTATNVVWIIDDENIYSYLLSNIDKLLQPNFSIKFKERILLEFNYVKIEIWYTDKSLAGKSLNYENLDIIIHSYEYIPLILKQTTTWE